jgi:hypothetical protein
MFVDVQDIPDCYRVVAIWDPGAMSRSLVEFGCNESLTPWNPGVMNRSPGGSGYNES